MNDRVQGQSVTSRFTLYTLTPFLIRPCISSSLYIALGFIMVNASSEIQKILSYFNLLELKDEAFCRRLKIKENELICYCPAQNCFKQFKNSPLK